MDMRERLSFLENELTAIECRLLKIVLVLHQSYLGHLLEKGYHPQNVHALVHQALLALFYYLKSPPVEHGELAICYALYRCRPRLVTHQCQLTKHLAIVGLAHFLKLVDLVIVAIEQRARHASNHSSGVLGGAGVVGGLGIIS